MRRVLILGAGGHGQVVADILLASRDAGSSDTPIGFLDDDQCLAGSSILGLPVLGTIAQLDQIEHDAVVVAIGDNRSRQRLVSFLRDERVQFANAVHPGAMIASGVRLGLGLVICAGAVVGTGSIVGDAVILNTACTVDHHNRIADYAHVCPGVHLGGGVSIGEGAMIGIGSAVTPGRVVGDWSVVGAGSVVIADVAPERTAVGAPARVIGKVRGS